MPLFTIVLSRLLGCFSKPVHIYILYIINQDKGIQKDKTGFYQCFEYMCTQIFSLHLKSLACKPRDANRQQLLENLAQVIRTGAL